MQRRRVSTESSEFITLLPVQLSASNFHLSSVHAANGYLVQQSINNIANKRTDKWGGSAENRVRLNA